MELPGAGRLEVEMPADVEGAWQGSEQVPRCRVQRLMATNGIERRAGQIKCPTSGRVVSLQDSSPREVVPA